jgi:MFS family permease
VGTGVLVFDGTNANAKDLLFDNLKLLNRNELLHPTYEKLNIGGRTWLVGVQLAPTRTAAVSAGILTLGEVGYTISTPILGWLGDKFSLQWALGTALPCGLLMLIAVLFLPRKIITPVPETPALS